MAAPVEPTKPASEGMDPDMATAGVRAAGRSREALDAVFDRRLEALVMNRFHPEIARTYGLPAYAGELPFHLEPARWYAGYLSVHEGSAPMEVREGMQHPVPQAQLRDLYRPMHPTSQVLLEFREIPLDPGGRLAMAELRSLLRFDPLPQLVQSCHLVAEEQQRRRGFLAAPWQPHLADDQPRRDVFVPMEPSLSA